MTRGDVLTSAATSVAVRLHQENAAATCSWYRRLRSWCMQPCERHVRRVMMRIGFLSLPVPGHLNPMTTLARTLQARGHDVVLLSLADVAPWVAAAGPPFVPCAGAAYPAGSLGQLVRRLSALSGEEALHFTVHAMMQGYTAALFASLPETLAKAGVEGMVLDQYQPYVELIP